LEELGREIGKLMSRHSTSFHYNIHTSHARCSPESLIPSFRPLLPLVLRCYSPLPGDIADGTESKYNVKITNVVVDLSSPELRKTGFAEVENLTKTLDIGLLGK
jgi:hypothetical protein